VNPKPIVIAIIISWSMFWLPLAVFTDIVFFDTLSWCLGLFIGFISVLWLVVVAIQGRGE
jgi:hypothetical protein